MKLIQLEIRSELEHHLREVDSEKWMHVDLIESTARLKINDYEFVTSAAHLDAN